MYLNIKIMTPYTIRDYTDSDLSEFLLFQQSIKKESIYLRAITKSDITTWTNDTIKIILAINNHNKIIGAIIYDRNEYKTYYITQLAVLQEYTRLGIASTLLDQLNNQALSEQVDTIWLTVESTNTSAINLYLKKRFVLEDKTSPYDDGFEAMYKSLN